MKILKEKFGELSARIKASGQPARAWFPQYTPASLLNAENWWEALAVCEYALDTKEDEKLTEDFFELIFSAFDCNVEVDLNAEEYEFWWEKVMQVCDRVAVFSGAGWAQKGAQYSEARYGKRDMSYLFPYYEKAAAKGETIPEHYDVTILTQKLAIALTADPESGIDDYINGDERTEYRNDRAETLSSVFLAVNMTDEANVRLLLDALSSYGVTEEKFESFGYGDYARAKDIARTSIITYRGRLDYEISEITAEKGTPGYEAAVASVKAELTKDVTSSLLSSLPKEVSEALEDIGQADLYTLIVGSIFYKLAGLLLPIIFMIMAANNLISGQVDSGSMAYVLSTSTKRKTVAVTQAIYLIGSLLVMFVLTTVTGCICLAIVKEDVQLTYGKLVLLNAGAFLVLFALSGLNFFTSCWFDRSKRSMAIGGGLSIFALVAAMLGLFGSPVIPKVVRLDSLNYFNYTTIISLFDVVSIMDGNLTFLWKFAILFVVGIIGYVAGSVKFVKKDLPL